MLRCGGEAEAEAEAPAAAEVYCPFFSRGSVCHKEISPACLTAFARIFVRSSWSFSSLFRWGTVQSKAPTAAGSTPPQGHNVIGKAPAASGAPAAAGFAASASAGSGSSDDGPSCASPSSSPFSLAKPWTWFRSRGSQASCCGCDETASAVAGGYQARCRTGVSDAGLPLSKFPAASFDTVIDSFGLCSHEDPVQARSVIMWLSCGRWLEVLWGGGSCPVSYHNVLPALCREASLSVHSHRILLSFRSLQVLREASRVCKPDGRILLLEHGRAHYGWLNARLDSSAEQHHTKWGCWWNRDINDIIKQVRPRLGDLSCSQGSVTQPVHVSLSHIQLFVLKDKLEAYCFVNLSVQAGLRVEKTSRWHFGTTYIVIARPAV